jgi:hypothetical protein
VTITDPKAVAAFQQAFAEFENFGRRLEFPIGMTSVSLTAPSGLGGEFESVSAVITPNPSAEVPMRRLQPWMSL